MKKILISIITLFVTVWACNAQSRNPITIYNAGEMVFSASEDSVVIGGVFPITFTNINYYTHGYDSSTGVHFFSFAVQIENSCSRFDQEFNIWITEDLYPWYYAYTDHCEGIILFKGDSQIAEGFRSENQFAHDIKNRR